MYIVLYTLLSLYIIGEYWGLLDLALITHIIYVQCT